MLKGNIYSMFRTLLIVLMLINSAIVFSEAITHSILSNGTWYKMRINRDGVYKLTYNQLKEIGIVKPENVKIYSNCNGLLPKATNNLYPSDLQENSIQFIPGNDNVFNSGDYILFYGKGPDIWQYKNNNYYHLKHKFDDYSYYFITEGSEKANDIEIQLAGVSNNYTSTTFDDYAFHEIDSVNLFKSGSELYGESLENGRKVTYSFPFQNISVNDSALFYYSIIARSSKASSMTVELNTENLTIDFRPVDFTINTSLYAYEVADGVTFKPNPTSVSAVLTYYNKNDFSGYAEINYIGFNLRRQLKYTGDQLRFRDKNSVKKGRFTKYEISNANSNLTVWNVTDAYHIKRIQTNFANNTISFIQQNDSVLQEYVVFDASSKLLTPSYKSTEENNLGLVSNQDIHGAETPNLIIVSPDDTSILNQANRLAEFREKNDGLKTLVLTLNQIYNEFSSGSKDITAIRNMAYMFYNRDKVSETFKYLLLFGDGTFMNKRSCAGNTNLIPTYQSVESLNQGSSYVTDDFFGWFNYNIDENYNSLKIGVGRLPIDNNEQAKEVVDKLIHYNSNDAVGDWRNKMCFIGDDEDGNIHVKGADELAAYVSVNRPNFLIQKIYLDAYPEITSSIGTRYPDVNKAINTLINKGVFLVNYTGHANEGQLAHEEILTKQMIEKWQNYNSLPLFVTATCEFSRFDDFNQSNCTELTAAGEEIIMHPKGGAIALLTTTRLVYSSNNQELNLAFYKHLFEKLPNGEYPRLGDIFKLTKNQLFDDSNKLNFTLLGDPSLMLTYPKTNSIVTDSINGVALIDPDSALNGFEKLNDTIKALSLVTVKGHINNQLDKTDTTYNGLLYPTVLDKIDNKNTLGNNDNAKFRFTTQDNTIYSGKINAEKGTFKFTFPVPKDIRYNYDKGKIIYYGFNAHADVTGFTTDFIVGGLDKNAIVDYVGPQISAFMNDTLFRNGSITGPNPKVMVTLFDESGINATGSGIGHDITGVLDNNFSQMFTMNEFYQSELNDYRKGHTLYPLYSLTPGKHTIKVTAWDIFNNSSESEITFEVKPSENISVINVKNYPNPFAESTTFSFEHNLADEEIEASLYIYNFAGETVTILKKKGTPTGFNTGAFNWNGTNSNGKTLPNGIYPYRLIINSKNSGQAGGNGKMLLLRKN